MSANKKFHLISYLKPFNDVWRVQVKLIHSWIQNPPCAYETLEMVLATVSSIIFVFFEFFKILFISDTIICCY